MIRKIVGAVFICAVSIFFISCSNMSSESTNNSGEGSVSGDTYLPWEGGAAYYSQWSNGPRSDENFFPIAVWLQSTYNANAYKAIGINTYIGLWEGPTSDQLKALASEAIQMPVICDQNATGLTDSNRAIIRAWLHQDEPDNAQSDGHGGYGPPVATSEIINRYNTMKSNDITRPVYLNLGQGVAWDGWWGRGVRTNHPEDYVEYAKGADILCYDIYPMNLDPSDGWDAATISEVQKVSQNIWYVAYGIDRLREWSNYKKPIWMALECTNFTDSTHPPTPAIVKAEVWMAIIHGARGIVYFCHVFSPLFIEAGLLADTAMRDAVAAINTQITSLAPVLNTQSVGNGVSTSSSNSAVPVDTMLKRYNGYTYLFSVAMRPGTTTATFTLRSFPANASAEVLGEGRIITVNKGVFQDSFTNYSVHLYKIK